MGQLYLWVLIALSLISAFLVHPVSAITDPHDVIALENLYASLNQPPELVGWKLGGDPCEQSWKGISCSGSSIIFINLSGLNLSGHLGGQLSQLVSLKQLNVSFNHIDGGIPYSLPPNVTHIDLSSNNFSEQIPYSIMFLKYLHHLNLSHNSLSGPVGNVFTDLQNLKQMDLSYNNLTGDLPSSFECLTHLTSLFLQKNQLTGSVMYLANLTLVDLNIHDNHFSGVIPKQFLDIPNLWIGGGNKFHEGVDSSPWNFPTDTVPTDENFRGEPHAQTNAIESYPAAKVHKRKSRRPTLVGLAGILLAVALIGAVAAIVTRSPARVSNGDPASPNLRVSTDTDTAIKIDNLAADHEENATPATLSQEEEVEQEEEKVEQESNRFVFPFGWCTNSGLQMTSTGRMETISTDPYNIPNNRPHPKVALWQTSRKKRGRVGDSSNHRTKVRKAVPDHFDRCCVCDKFFWYDRQGVEVVKMPCHWFHQDCSDALKIPRGSCPSCCM